MVFIMDDSQCLDCGMTLPICGCAHERLVSISNPSNEPDEKWQIGMLVRADEDITEMNFMVKGELYYHAYKGDDGIIEYIAEDGYPMVRFTRSGTATDVGHDQIFKYPRENNHGFRVGKKADWRDARE